MFYEWCLTVGFVRWKAPADDVDDDVEVGLGNEVFFDKVGCDKLPDVGEAGVATIAN